MSHREKMLNSPSQLNKPPPPFPLCARFRPSSSLPIQRIRLWLPTDEKSSFQGIDADDEFIIAAYFFRPGLLIFPYSSSKSRPPFSLFYVYRKDVRPSSDRRSWRGRSGCEYLPQSRLSFDNSRKGKKGGGVGQNARKGWRILAGGAEGDRDGFLGEYEDTSLVAAGHWKSRSKSEKRLFRS